MNKQMFSAGIDKVRIIPATATNNVPRDLVIIVLSGLEQPIIRTFKQFILDLQESHLVPRTINDVNHPDVLDVVRDIQGGTVKGDVQFWKKGSEYIVDENSSVVTNTEHADYGNVKVGDKHTRISDGSRVEGFLTLDRSTENKMAERTAKKTAQLVAAMIGVAQQPLAVESSPEQIDMSGVELGEEPEASGDAKSKSGSKKKPATATA